LVRACGCTSSSTTPTAEPPVCRTFLLWIICPSTFDVLFVHSPARLLQPGSTSTLDSGATHVCFPDLTSLPRKASGLLRYSQRPRPFPLTLHGVGDGVDPPSRYASGAFRRDLGDWFTFLIPTLFVILYYVPPSPRDDNTRWAGPLGRGGLVLGISEALFN